MGIVRRVAFGFGAPAATLVRVEAEIPHKMLPGIGDVLGELGDEVEGVEDLEVAGDAVEEVRARRPGESPARSLLGEVDHLVLLGAFVERGHLVRMDITSSDGETFRAAAAVRNTLVFYGSSERE